MHRILGKVYYWFNENQCTAYLEPVHGSSNTTLLAKLLFLGDFIDIKRLESKIADCLVAADSSRKKTEYLLQFGIKARRNKELTTFIKDSVGERKCHLWVLKPDNLVEVHCDRPLAPLLKKVLFTGFNSQKDRRKMIGGYFTRVVPELGHMTSGSQTKNKIFNLYKKHAAVVHSKRVMVNCSIKDLNTPYPVPSSNKNIALRAIILSIPFPLKEDPNGHQVSVQHCG